MTEVLFARLDEMLAADASLQAQITAIAPIDNASIIGLSLLPTATGFLVETANGSPNTFTQRSIVGTASQIIVTNGDGVAGNPILSLSSAVIIPGSITLNPTALSNNAGLSITQSTPATGTVAGPISLNTITVTHTAQTITGGFPVDQWGQIGDQIDSFRVNTKVNGNISNAFGINSPLVVTASTGGASSIVSSVYANSPGNTIVGNLWSNIAVGEVGPTTNLNNAVIGYSAEMLVADTGVVLHRIGFEANSQGPTAGTSTDAAYMINTFNLSVTNFLTAAPWKTGLYLSSNFYGAATFPIAATGDIILSDTGTVANFIKAPTLTVTGNILSFPNVKISGSGGAVFGSTTAAAASGILLITNLAAGFTIYSSATTLAGNTPAFNVDASTALAVTGVYIFSDIAGNGAQIITTSSGTNEKLKINAKGSGTVDIGGTSTGGLTVHGSFTATGLVTSADLNSDVFSTAHSWAGQQTFTSPILGTPASGVATNLTGTASGLTAGNVTTNANLTGVITSVGNATSIASQTGTGTKFVVDTSPTLITPALGVATATSLAIGGAAISGLAFAVLGTVQIQDAGPTNFINLGFSGTPGGYTSNFQADATGLKIGTNSAVRDVEIQTNSTTRVTILLGMGVGTTSDPGVGLIYQNSASFLMRTKTTWNTGAGVGAGTLTNAPSSGNPTKWIPVDDNGTTRYIPAW